MAKRTKPRASGQGPLTATRRPAAAPHRRGERGSSILFVVYDALSEDCVVSWRDGGVNWRQRRASLAEPRGSRADAAQPAHPHHASSWNSHARDSRADAGLLDHQWQAFPSSCHVRDSRADAGLLDLYQQQLWPSSRQQPLQSTPGSRSMSCEPRASRGKTGRAALFGFPMRAERDLHTDRRFLERAAPYLIHPSKRYGP